MLRCGVVRDGHVVRVGLKCICLIVKGNRPSLNLPFYRVEEGQVATELAVSFFREKLWMACVE